MLSEILISYNATPITIIRKFGLFFLEKKKRKKKKQKKEKEKKRKKKYKQFIGLKLLREQSCLSQDK